MMCPVHAAVCGAAAAERRTGAPDGSCFQYTGNGAAMSHIFLLNNPHFQKEFQKMMAWKRTVFVFSLRFCAFFAAMSKEKVPEKRRKTPDFSAFLCRKKQAITRKHPCFSVKIFTIAVERGIRPPAAGLRRIIPGSAGHD